MKSNSLLLSLTAAMLAVSALPVSAADTVTLTPPEKMPSSVGALEICCDRDLNGAAFEVWRIQPEGEFCYYSHTIGLCEDSVFTCPLWEGDYRLILTLPVDTPGDAPKYTREFTLEDPEMDAAQSFSRSVYTVTLSVSAEIAEDILTETEPQNIDRVITGGCSYQFARRAFSLGDLNADGIVNAADAADMLIAVAAAGAGSDPGLTTLQCAECDANGDGAFDSADAADILVYAANAAAGDFEGDLLTFMRNAGNDTNSAGNAD